MSPPTITLAVGSLVRHGRALRLGRAVDPAVVCKAIRQTDPVALDGTELAIEAPAPGSVHEFVGCIHPGMGLRIRTALAQAGRSRGLSTPHDETLDDLQAALAELDPPRSDTADHRRAVAEAAAETERLHEQVATARGRVAAQDDGPSRERLADVIQELSEVETKEAATRERLARERSDRRRRRDRLERRLELEDRIANLERAARSHLVDHLREEFARAVVLVPSTEPAPSHTDEPGLFDVDPVTAALAIAQISDLSAPIALACDRFVSPQAAHECLRSPIIQV
jgi:hypothetical protein